jgi:hypothetical protein
MLQPVSQNGNGKNATENANGTLAPPSPVNGNRLRVGKGIGGKKGRSGRKPEWLRRWCDDLLANASAKSQVQAILSDKDHPAFAAMWRAVADRAHGKPHQAVEHTGRAGGPIIVQFVRE